MEIKNTAIHLEEAILGGIISDKEAILKVIDIIKSPRVFYDYKHEVIYNAILNMFNNNERIDLLTLANRLKKVNQLETVGGDIFLINLLNKVTSTAHIENHCRIIQQCYIKREAVRYSQILKAKSEDDSQDIFDIIDGMNEFTNEISNEIVTKKAISISEITQEIIAEAGKHTKGVNMPLTALNEQCNGWQKSNLIIVAGRPGMGKSAYLNSIALASDVPVGVFSLEMNPKELVKRMIADKIGITNRRLQKNTLNPYEIEKIKGQINMVDDLEIYIDDTPSIKLSDLRTKAKMMYRMKGVRLLIIDYLQLMTVKDKSMREQEISAISRGLKALAKELDIPIIALAQLSRNVESRADKRPMLSDLRESGAIEQDADIIQFIYRPEYYGLSEWDGDDEIGVSCMGQAEIIQAKDRNGVVNRFRCQFIADRQRFCDIGEKEYLPPIKVKEELKEDDFMPF